MIVAANRSAEEPAAQKPALGSPTEAVATPNPQLSPSLGNSEVGGPCDEEDPCVMLREVVERFHDASSLKAFECVEAGEVPEPNHSILVNEEHLTKTLMDRHGVIDVRVVEVKRGDGGVYARRIYLANSNGEVVAHAILIAYLDRLPAPVKKGVLEEGIPFGKLLMDHVKERCVRLKAFWRVDQSLGSAGGFGVEAETDNGEKRITYGRTVVIDCDGVAAAEVLEVLPCVS